MTKAANKPSEESQNTARVVDGKLILSLPGAINPVVWQMDLHDINASALKVEESSKPKGFKLAFSTSNSDVTDVAIFEEKSQAVEALMAASHALENAHGTIHGIEQAHHEPHKYAAHIHMAHPHKQPHHKGHTWLKVIFVLVLLVALFTVWGNSQPRAPQSLQSAGDTVSQSQTQSANEAGVPVSADAFLQGR